MTERTLDLAAVRAKLQAKTGKQYWRSLEELAEDPHFEELLQREFPRQAPSEWDEGVDRRDFLKLMAASLAFAGLSGCGLPPREHIVPYVKQPEGMVLGKPMFFATVMPFGADAIGLLVESHEGRPTKIEGNPDHPSSLGGTNAFAQASVLNLYDPDRAQVTTNIGDMRSWSQFVDSAQAEVAAIKMENGAGFHILTGTIVSPLVADEIQALLKAYPLAKWHQWEPAVSDGAREGAKLAFGRYLNTVYRVDKADVILSLDSDFLASGPGNVRYMKDFYRRRKLTGPESEMNRLYVVEPTPTVTGSTADHRLPMRASSVETFARALAAKLGLGGAASLPGTEKWLNAVAADLQKHRGSSLVVAGEQQSAEVHALAHAINAALGNSGVTVYQTEPVEAQPVNHLQSMTELCAAMDAGKVDTLLMIGVNPIYTAPHDFDFTSKIKKVRNAIQVSSHFDETAAYSQWHIAESHFLETWGDARAFDGTLSVIQPLIAPLYSTHSAREVLAAFSDKPGVSDYDALREKLKTSNAGGDFEKFWRKTLNDGVVANSAFAPIAGNAAKFSVASLPATKAPSTDLEFIFRPDPSIYDGRFANNGWLQELPKPLTKLVWDNAALLSAKTVEDLQLSPKIAARGGEHGQIVSNVVDISLSNSKVTAAVWTLPGQADGVVVLPLGYGRTRAGYTGTNKGFNAYVVRSSQALFTASGGSLKKTGDNYPLACTQYHFNMEGRQILATGTLAKYKQNPNFAHEHDEQPAYDDSLYKPQDFPYAGKPAWAMAIDLNSCNGCNACVVACQSENNIPVVGKDQVMRGREMHWIRVDRYYTDSLSATETGNKETGDPSQYNSTLDNPETYFQPVPCQQCENAPCEQVCPGGRHGAQLRRPE